MKDREKPKDTRTKGQGGTGKNQRTKGLRDRGKPKDTRSKGQGRIIKRTRVLKDSSGQGRTKGHEDIRTVKDREDY